MVWVPYISVVGHLLSSPAFPWSLARKETLLIWFVLRFKSSLSPSHNPAANKLGREREQSLRTTNRSWKPWPPWCFVTAQNSVTGPEKAQREGSHFIPLWNSCEDPLESKRFFPRG